ncbi:nSTAND1 domain-containing NTPase [Nostoc sp. 'Peltigera membranacea cyanobiont' N6]|uniref:nSTAND1 domain-containing NTPase n=1 Tax=Nostoc sp. 'Peltigera membranacea cyanobiont' N6 TaxID=1261031 RepID=UPI000CF35F87|nr:hypothetical protein [Nostoc sp. 'Peltigera membranacea cyanobiont' N6]AVH68387.1 WD40 repeat-containing protein [Nostoc sp. 'Peltigera membranacea cyanobiont' N6]
MSDNTSSYYAEIGGDFKGIQGDISGGIINQYIITQKSGVDIRSQPLISGSPYVGLTKFKEKDKDKFFGRDGQIISLSNYLEQNKLLLLMGVSGSGKSSLVLAGLIPHLENKWGTSKFSQLIFEPTADPFQSLDRNIPNEYRNIVGDLISESTEDILIRLVNGINQDYERQLIFIDQFEELFTLTPPDKQELFVKCLLRLIEQQNSSIHLVMTMRSDFLGSLSPYPELATALEKHIRIIKDMTRNELRLSIAEPAARNHVIFEGNLVEIIIDDFLGQAGSLPLLQYTLDLLWQRDKELDGLTDQVLNLSTYQDKDFGGVGGALQKQANIIYKKLNADEQKVAQKIFLELVDIVDEKRVSKPVELKTFQDGGVQEKVVNILIEKRLLVRGTDESDKTGIVQVAHEELLRSWDILDALFREKEDILLLRRRLVTDAKEWDELRKQDPRKAINALILNVPKLTKIINLAKEKSLLNLDALVTEFIKASIKYQNQVQTIEAERKQREVSTELSLANSLARYSSSLFDTHHELEAFVEAIKAGKILQKQKATDGKVIDALHKVLVEGSEYNRLEGHDNSVNSVSFSSDGKTLASGSWNKTIKLWNVHTGEEIRTLKGHDESVSSVSFSSDGKTLASGSRDKTIKLWNVETGEEIRTLKGHDYSVSSVSFSCDGKTLASASEDKTIKLWNVQTGEEIRTLKGHDESVSSVSFSSDDKTLASASEDKTIKLWNVQIGEEIRTLKGHDHVVYSVSFSSDGKTLASASEDKTIKLWNVQTGEEIRTLKGHDHVVYSVSFSSDCKTLASGSVDIKLWNVETGEEIRTLKEYDEPVISVSFSSDGKTLASGSLDKTIKLWNVQTGEEIRTLKGHDESVISVSFSSDGKTLASGSEDKTIKLWNIQTAEEICTLKGHDHFVSSVSFSSDGKTLASGSRDKTIKLWNIQTAEEICTLKGHDHFVSSVSFSSDGKTLASGSRDKTIKLWNIQTGEEIRTLKGHDHFVYSVSFSSDGKTLASGSGDRTIKLWDMDLNSLMGRSCDWVRNYLQNNPKVSESDRHLCDGIGTQK